MSWKLAQIPGEEWQHAHITAFGWTVSEQLMLSWDVLQPLAPDECSIAARMRR